MVTIVIDAQFFSFLIPWAVAIISTAVGWAAIRFAVYTWRSEDFPHLGRDWVSTIFSLFMLFVGFTATIGGNFTAFRMLTGV